MSVLVDWFLFHSPGYNSDQYRASRTRRDKSGTTNFLAAATVGEEVLQNGEIFRTYVCPSLRPGWEALRPGWRPFKPDWLICRPGWLIRKPGWLTLRLGWLALKAYTQGSDGRTDWKIISSFYRTSSSYGAAALLQQRKLKMQHIGNL